MSKHVDKDLAKRCSSAAELVQLLRSGHLLDAKLARLRINGIVLRGTVPEELERLAEIEEQVSMLLEEAALRLRRLSRA